MRVWFKGAVDLVDMAEYGFELIELWRIDLDLVYYDRECFEMKGLLFLSTDSAFLSFTWFALSFFHPIFEMARQYLPNIIDQSN